MSNEFYCPRCQNSKEVELGTVTYPDGVTEKVTIQCTLCQVRYEPTDHHYAEIGGEG